MGSARQVRNVGAGKDLATEASQEMSCIASHKTCVRKSLEYVLGSFQLWLEATEETIVF